LGARREALDLRAVLELDELGALGISLDGPADGRGVADELPDAVKKVGHLVFKGRDDDGDIRPAPAVGINHLAVGVTTPDDVDGDHIAFPTRLPALTSFLKALLRRMSAWYSRACQLRWVAAKRTGSERIL